MQPDCFIEATIGQSAPVSTIGGIVRFTALIVELAIFVFRPSRALTVGVTKRKLVVLTSVFSERMGLLRENNV